MGFSEADAWQLAPYHQQRFGSFVDWRCKKNGQQCLNNSLTPSFSAWADAMGNLPSSQGDHIPLLKTGFFLAGHPSQGCFGLQSHYALHATCSIKASFLSTLISLLVSVACFYILHMSLRIGDLTVLKCGDLEKLL
ncbi:hypothetical protein TNCV_4904531 [Trichonephila clavipes]|nr:hypothetical protein TNCV_4904531 [Trichonephila clavipes]